MDNFVQDIKIELWNSPEIGTLEDEFGNQAHLVVIIGEGCANDLKLAKYNATVKILESCSFWSFKLTEEWK